MNFLKWHDIIIIGLAVWRISSLFVKEDGFWHIFLRLRKMVGFKKESVYDDNKVFIDELEFAPDTYLGDLFSCVWCFSMVQSIIWYVAWLIEPNIMYVLMPFAIGAVAIIIDKLVE